MKIIGNGEMEWGIGHVRHVLVAARGARWGLLCRVLPSDYVTWDPTLFPVKEEKTSEAVVWKHDRSKISCKSCIAVLDGATIETHQITPPRSA